MVKDYLSSRQNVIPGKATELNAKLVAIVLAFDEAWLTIDGTHPLQSLWKRIDALATNELLNFGDAVELLHLESPDWLKGQVDIIKNGDAGQSAGAVFEIMALKLFSRQFCKVVPAPASMPGFDGTLVLNDHSRVFVSIKNHGQSSREQDFIASAKAVDDEFRAQLGKHGLRDLEVNVLALKHLDATDFENIKTDIDRCLLNWKAGESGGALNRPYSIILKSMANQYSTLSNFEVSSSCRVMVPIAPNEQTNFEDAIRKGCENLYKHTKHETGDFCRMIILRLSNTATIAKCQAWANWYFTEYPNDPVDVILLYQASVVTDAASDTSAISHYLSLFTGPRFPVWQKTSDGKTRRLPSMSILVGVISQDQPTMILTGDGENGVDLSNYYIYQRADVYLKVEFRDGASANLSNPASGIMVHAVFEQDGVPLGSIQSKAEREKVLALLP